jgi:hypothetical protein
VKKVTSSGNKIKERPINNSAQTINRKNESEILKKPWKSASSRMGLQHENETQHYPTKHMRLKSPCKLKSSKAYENQEERKKLKVGFRKTLEKSMISEKLVKFRRSSFLLSLSLFLFNRRRNSSIGGL